MASMTQQTGNEAIAWNFKLLAHHEFNGFGGLGEGMAIQVTRDGRRILWTAHERAPKNFTGTDVTDPRAPKVIVQTDLPVSHMRSNSLDVVDDVMAVAYQTTNQGQKPAGFELFDISVPENPRSISFFDCSGPNSRGVHQLWFRDGRYIHMSSGAADFTPRSPRDDQFYRIIDVQDLLNPVEVGRWWLPGTREGDAEPPVVRHTDKATEYGFRAHNTNVYPERPDRAYLGYIDGGMVILDISDMSAPKCLSRWDHSPPFGGFTHTVMPLFEKNLLLVADESTTDDGSDLPKLIWVLDGRDETNPVPISTCPSPTLETFRGRGKRIGVHNIHENVPGPYSWRSEQIIFGTFFNAGVRAYDLSSPYQPREVGYFVPPSPAMAPHGAIALNDVFVDERGIVYTVDRHVGGLYILETNL